MNEATPKTYAALCNTFEVRVFRAEGEPPVTDDGWESEAEDIDHCVVDDDWDTALKLLRDQIAHGRTAMIQQFVSPHMGVEYFLYMKTWGSYGSMEETDGLAVDKPAECWFEEGGPEPEPTARTYTLANCGMFFMPEMEK
jgi:hypothetical protein